MVPITFSSITFPAILMINRDPKLSLKISSGETLESEQVMTIAKGFCTKKRFSLVVLKFFAK